MALSAKGMSLPGRASRPSVAARAHPASRDVALAVVLLSASPALAIDASAYDALAKGYRRSGGKASRRTGAAADRRSCLV